MKKARIGRLTLSRETLGSLSNSTLHCVGGGTTLCPMSGPMGYTCVTYEYETCPPTHTDCQ